MNRGLRLASVLAILLAAATAVPQGLNVPSIQLGVGQAQGQNEVSASLQILALLTVLSLAPALLILTTAFTRIVIVLSLVRSALGTQSIPPNQVIVGLSLFLTFFVMGPTFEQVNETALQPYMRKENPITFDEAVKRGQVPIRDFMLKNTYESDLRLFTDIRKERPRSREEVAFGSLVPAFVISELKTAFVVGFFIFVPFVMIDLIVASVLMGMGMMMMPPTVVSLPVKLLVFVLANGWHVLVQAILAGYSP